ncbi:MAG: peptidase, partial [Blautia sp.]|nr:peptidase [Blautia sp.]
YLGQYFIKELIPSEGYLLDEKEYDLDCAYEGDLVKTVKKTATSKEQVIKQPFQVIKAANNGKTDADLLKGVGFSAYLISSLQTKKDGSYDFSKAKPIVLTENGGTEMFTDEKGYAVSIPIPYGKYIIRETTTPHNFTPVDDFKVTISENHPKEPQQWRVLLDDEFEAKLMIIKKDDETKKPVLLPKTEFKVYDMDNKKYVEQVTTYPSVVTHKSYFTDENGYLILPNNLKIGHYRIEEVNAPYGYVLNHNAFEVLVDSNTAYQMDQTSGDAIIEVVMENQPVKGKLTIKKSGEVLASFDKDFGYEMTSLADAEFAVYAAEDIYTPDYQRDENGNRIVIYAKDALVAMVTTGADGSAVVEDLPLGTYRIEETKAPFGFVLNTEPQTVTFAYADQETPVIGQTAEFTNDRQKVEITVEKQDVETGKKLSGAVFGLYAASAIASADHEKVLVEADTLLEEATSDENGLAAFMLDLPIGQYYVKEHKAPAGYVSSDEILNFDAGYQGQDVPVVKLTSVKRNEPTTFEFTKSDITTGTELEGAVLTILTRSGDVIERWTSVKNEPHMVKCLTAGESYVLREEFAPYGYLRATDVVFTVKDTAEIQKVEMKDEVPTALLIINKKGEFLDKVTLLDNTKGTVEHMFEYISGNLTPVTFEVYAAEDIHAADEAQPDYYKKDDLVGTITTDDTGIAKVGDLPVGKYYVVEKETAYGYVLDNAPRFVDLSYRDQDTPIVVYDEKWQNARQKVSLHLVKKEKGTEAPLKGAIFGLYTAEDIKSKDGKVLIEKDTLIEQKTTDVNGEIGFIADLPIDGKYYVTELFAPNGYVNAQEKQDFTFTYGGSDKDLLSYSFTFVNEPTTVELSKADITTGKELPGAHLRVIDENAVLIDEWVSTETPHIIQKLVVGREYELIETKPADGYVTAESVTFKIENTGEVQKMKMEDDVTKVYLSKSDITDGKPVIGAKLSIIDETGDVVETWTTTEKEHYIEKLPVGKYTLREETAPAGYLVAEDVLFTVKDTGVEQKVEMKDDYTKVEITKSDITDGKPVIGAKLTILDKDGKEVESWVTEEKPHYIEKLPVGEYTLREVTAPDGYLRAEDVKFTVKETGEIQKVAMKDDYTKVEISKQDITNSKEIPGAKLTIFDKDGKEVESWVSKEKPHYIEKLLVGEYTLREVTAPEGYEVAEDVKFTVAETGEIQTVVMKDAPKKQPETPTTETPTNPSTPTNPTNPSTPTTTTETPKETPTTPKTGDDRNPLLWLLLFGIGGCMAGAAWYLRKKDEKDQNQD